MVSHSGACRRDIAVIEGNNSSHSVDDVHVLLMPLRVSWIRYIRSPMIIHTAGVLLIFQLMRMNFIHILQDYFAGKAPVILAPQNVYDWLTTTNSCSHCNHHVIRTNKCVRKFTCRSIGDQSPTCLGLVVEWWATTTHKHWRLFGDWLVNGH